MTQPWGYLERIGGSEDGTTVPPKIVLQDSECFVGRFTEPVKTADSKFTHKTQTLIPCLFVSSTHFSIGKTGQPNTYFIKDYSRNGTVLNQKLVGPNNTVEFNDGAEISLHYKNKVRISYRFRAEAAPVVPVSPRTTVSAVKEEREDEESARFASMRSQADSVEFALNKHIGVLTDENKQQEARIQQQTKNIEELNSDLHRANEKNVALERNVTSLEQEKADLAERLSTNESHCAAIEARNQKLVEQVEESKTELRDLKAKNAQLTEDLQTKTSQLEARNALVESSNKTMTHEKNKWTKLENKYTAACEKLQAAQEEIVRVKLASQTLQDILSDRDAALQHARLRYDKLREVFEAGRSAVQRREEDVQNLQNKLSAAAQLLSALTTESEELVAQNNFFEELAAGLEGQHDYSSQLSIRNEDTYAEGSYHSQLTSAPSPSRTSSAMAATPEGVHAPTATGTVNGADSPTPSRQQHQQARGLAGAQRLDIESEGGSQGGSQGFFTGAPAPTADSQTQAQTLGRHGSLQSQGKSHGQSPSQSQGGRGSEKRKRSQEDAGEAKKHHSEQLPIVNREEMDVQAEARDEASDKEEADVPEDMQATQAPANFSHLFEDSDPEVEEVEEAEEEGERKGEGEGEWDMVHRDETIDVMEVVEVDADGEGEEEVREVVSNEVEVVDLASPVRHSHHTTTTTTSTTAVISEGVQGLAPKATSVTCTDDSASETSFDASGALLGRAVDQKAPSQDQKQDQEQEGQVSSSHSKPLLQSQDEEF